MTSRVASLDDSDAMVRRAGIARWTPPGSSVRPFRTGTLNCRNGECEFIVYPM
jgi:hypothetical protein